MTMMNAPYYTQDFVKGAVLVVALMFTFYLSSRRGQSRPLLITLQALKR